MLVKEFDGSCPREFSRLQPLLEPRPTGVDAVVYVEFSAHGSAADVMLELFDFFLLIGNDSLHEISDRNHRDDPVVLEAPG